MKLSASVASVLGRSSGEQQQARAPLEGWRRGIGDAVTQPQTGFHRRGAFALDGPDRSQDAIHTVPVGWRRGEVHVRAVAIEHDGHLVTRTQLFREFSETLAHEFERFAVHGSGLVDHRDEIHRIPAPFLFIDVGGEAHTDEISRLRNHDELGARGVAREAEQLPAGFGGEHDVVFAHEPFGGQVVGMRDALELDLATEILDVLGTTLAYAHAGDYGLLELLVFGRDRRANNQRKQE
jgi:hypothetical protein